MSAISGFCEKCNKFRKRHCDGNRNTCMSILFDTIEAQRQENERLADETIKLTRKNAQNSMRAESLTAEKDELIKVLKQARKALYAARVDVLTKETDELAREALAAIDKAIGGKAHE